MTYLEAKMRLLGKWRVIVIVINIIVLVLAVVGLYESGFFTRSWYNRDKATFFSLLGAYAIMNALLIYKPAKQSGNDEGQASLLGLWIKRKKLENEAKIKELEK